MPNTAPDILQVAVGVLIENGRVLVAKRLAGVHLAGHWEFPGGKIEPGESLEDAVKREFHEELNIQVFGVNSLMEISHKYPDQEVLLKVCRLDGFTGDLHGVEGQQVYWCNAVELEKLQFPPANSLILEYVARELQTV